MSFVMLLLFFFKQKTAYEMRISDWSSDVCSSDLRRQDDEAYAAELRAAEAEQQALVDQAAERDRLQAENEALRQQNVDYQNQLSQPVYNAPPTYWATPPYRPRHRDRDHDGNHEIGRAHV